MCDQMIEKTLRKEYNVLKALYKYMEDQLGIATLISLISNGDMPDSYIPSYEEGYPNPMIFNDDWAMTTCHIGYSKRREGSWWVIAYEMIPSARIEMCRAELTKHTENDVISMMTLVIHSCWKASLDYLYFIKYCNRDPLDWCSNGEDIDDLIAKHWNTPNALIEIRLQEIMGKLEEV